MPRTFDVDDLMVNTFGGAAGFCFSALVCRAAGKRVRLKQKGVQDDGVEPSSFCNKIGC